MKAFRFLFDDYTGLYTGVVRAPFPENSTEQEPHFNFDCKTVYDRNFHCWKLVPKFEFYQQFASNDLLATYDLETKRSILKLCEFLDEKFKQFRGKIDIHENEMHDRWFDIGKTLSEQGNKISANTDLIQSLKGCMLTTNDSVIKEISISSSTTESEIKFIKSQLMYLTNVIERPNFIVRFFRWIAGL